MKKVIIIAGLLSMLSGTARYSLAFDFIQNHFYALPGFGGCSLSEYDSSGHFVDSLQLDALKIGGSGYYGDDFRGLAFGPDNLLYVVNNLGPSYGYEVVAINSSGQVQQRYSTTTNLGQNASYGKIAFDQNNHFYVGTGSYISRFSISNPASAQPYFIPSEGYDVDVMPNGNILAMTESWIWEFDANGSPLDAFGGNFNHGRGLEYDPEHNTIYATTFGPSDGDYHTLDKYDASSHQRLERTTYTYGDDLCLASDGRLVVGSRTQVPGIFSLDLTPIGSFEGNSMNFVTQFLPVPEPSSWILAGLAFIGVLTYSLRRGGLHPRGAI